MKATISYKSNSQKGTYSFTELLTESVLKDICHRLTGQQDYDLHIISDGYNKGRLLTLEYDGVLHFITLSEVSIKGRNSSVQSVPTAINIFFSNVHSCKQLHYYFLKHVGNAFTDYHMMYYRMMATIGIDFLNADTYVNNINPFITIDEIITARERCRDSNKGNNSSFITINDDNIQLYAKVFGASKYESTLLALAAATIWDGNIQLYSICEQELKELPQASLNSISRYQNIEVINTSLFLDRKKFQSSTIERATLRSPVYIYNLLEKFGQKKCALCGCTIPEIIQGAHLWSVADIISSQSLSPEEKYNHAICKDNGLWLCNNHHKLFDSNLIKINNNRELLVSSRLEDMHIHFISSITPLRMLPENILNRESCEYLRLRNSTIFGDFKPF